MRAIQATVREWKSGVGGSALTDQGGVLELPAQSLGSGPFRYVRPGQRVTLELVDDLVVRVLLP